MIPVFWLSLHNDIKARGYWDQTQLEDLFANRHWDTGYTFEHHETRNLKQLEGKGGVVVIPARHHVDYSKDIYAAFEAMDWVIAVLTGDEEHKFDAHDIAYRQTNRIWIMTPKTPGYVIADDQVRFIGSGYALGARKLPDFTPTRELDWSFAGQITHERRQQCAEVLRKLDSGTEVTLSEDDQVKVSAVSESISQLIETEGFTQGLSQDQYFELLTQTKVVPCPSGPHSQDTFRVWEALEAGCVPVVDNKSPQGGEGFWELLLGQAPPFPTVDEWTEFPELLNEILDDFVNIQNRVFAWWQRYKMQMARNMAHDIKEASGIEPENKTDTTVLIPSSPIPSHPSTKIVDETVRSVRHHLSDVEIFIMCDGVRPEQQNRKPEYDLYLQSLLWKTNFAKNILPIVNRKHKHQVVLTRNTLKLVDTNTILFVEHDTPLSTLVPQIPFDELIGIINNETANIIRFSHEAVIPAPHRHLMLDRRPRKIEGQPLIRTVQYSARPHLAATKYYERVLHEQFSEHPRTFIEDRMHGVVMEDWHELGIAGWQKHRIWIYAPQGSIKRSENLDGRGDDPKFDTDLVF